MKEIKPYQSKLSKKEEIKHMFDGISSSYDKLNRILSAGIDKRWRKKLLGKVNIVPSLKILDVATGTGDLCFAFQKEGVKDIIGLDLSDGMLKVAVEKQKNTQLSKVKFMQGDAENLPFEDNVFDLVTVSFGVRNFQNLREGLKEIGRVLRPGGQVLILEFSQPKASVFKQLYNFYSGTILPTVGGAISKDKKAYKYLDVSSKNFPEGKEFMDILTRCGFEKIGQDRLSGGISTIYEAFKSC